MKDATTPNWYVGQFTNNKGKKVYRILRLRTLGTLERLLNGLAKNVLEYCQDSKWRKVTEKFTEVGGPFATRAGARRIKAMLDNKHCKA